MKIICIFWWRKIRISTQQDEHELRIKVCIYKHTSSRYIWKKGIIIFFLGAFTNYDRVLEICSTTVRLYIPYVFLDKMHYYIRFRFRWINPRSNLIIPKIYIIIDIKNYPITKWPENFSLWCNLPWLVSHLMDTAW